MAHGRPRMGPRMDWHRHAAYAYEAGHGDSVQDLALDRTFVARRRAAAWRIEDPRFDAQLHGMRAQHGSPGPPARSVR